jgi:putative membrane protein
MGDPNVSQLAVERTDLAAERTELARQRTLLAEQRTFSAWLRTGLAAVAVGLGSAELLGDLEPEWAVTAIAIILCVSGAGIFLVALQSYRSSLASSADDEAGNIPSLVVWAITLAMLAGAGVALALIIAN